MGAESQSKRRRLWRGLAAALAPLAVGGALALSGGAGATAKGPVSVVPATFYGVVSQTKLAEAEVARMAQGELGTVRTFINWGTVRSKNTLPNDWSEVDTVVAAAARSGIQVIPFVFGTPSWVAKNLDRRKCNPKTCGLYAPRGPAALAEWEAFLGEAVARYGPGGEFFAAHPELPAVPITTWQLWNEQNSKSFYLPKPDVSAYAALLTAGTSAIRAKDPTAKIVLGGMFGSPGGEKQPQLFAWNYLRKLYQVPGITDQFDGVGVHPYAARMSKVIEQVKLMHDEIVRAGDPAEMWITEIGWSSGTGENPLERGKQGQANRLRDAMRYFIGQQATFNIQNVTWFAWRDLAGKPICEWCANAGLFKAKTLTAKPAWKALMAFTGGS